MSTNKIVCNLCIIVCLIFLSAYIFSASVTYLANHQQQQE